MNLSHRLLTRPDGALTASFIGASPASVLRVFQDWTPLCRQRLVPIGKVTDPPFGPDEFNGLETELIMFPYKHKMTIILDNSRIPDQNYSALLKMAKELKTFALGVTVPPNNPLPIVCYTSFICCDGRGREVIERQVSANKDRKQWEFFDFGPRLPFEDVAAYSRRKIRDRLTSEMVFAYLKHFGIDCESDDGWDISSGIRYRIELIDETAPVNLVKDMFEAINAYIKAKFRQ